MIPATIGTRQCIPFRQKLLSRHLPFSRTLEAGYMKIAKRKNYIDANIALREVDKRLTRHDLNLSMDDEALQKWCARQADKVQRIVGKFGMERAESIVRGILIRYGIQYPDEVQDLFGIAPALNRCVCEKWWRRKVRVIQKRECDEIARAWHLVHDKGQIYASHHAVNLRMNQKRRNAKLLSHMVARNDEGQEYTLAELAQLSVSNPRIRRSELMVRMRGFEDLATSQGRQAVFYTITCPSKYHSTMKGGIPNEKFKGQRVREGNDYMVGMWARLRAALHRRGIDPYGFRVAEPHSDGCPHWHAVLFLQPHHVGPCGDLLSQYALAEDGDEEGARSNRVKVEVIDPAKGSATGYIAKYIAKAIDGHGMIDDLYGYSAQESAQRIEAWAATHGIRQFQQIGGPSVTVWRELRRLDSPEDGIIGEAREAADSSDWAAFCTLMGTGRGQAISIGRWQEFCGETGEILCPVKGRYGEPAALRIFGLVAGAVSVLTRFYHWTIDRPGLVNKPTRQRARVNLFKGLRLRPGVPQERSERSAAALAWILGERASGPPLEFCQ